MSEKTERLTDTWWKRLIIALLSPIWIPIYAALLLSGIVICLPLVGLFYLVGMPSCCLYDYVRYGQVRSSTKDLFLL